MSVQNWKAPVLNNVTNEIQVSKDSKFSKENTSKSIMVVLSKITDLIRLEFQLTHMQHFL